MNAIWETEGARLSVFTLGTDSLVFEAIEAIIGTPAIQVIIKPAEHVTIEIGVFKNYAVQISKGPQRCEIIFGLSPAAVNASDSYPTLGKPKDVMVDLVEVGRKWIKTLSDVKRLAVGLTAGCPGPTQEAALELLLQKVKSFSSGGTTVRELEIKLNRPRPSHVDASIEINRLAKWQAVQLQLIQVSAAGGIGVTTPLAANRAQVEIDVNTSAFTAAPIPANKLMEYVNELAALAVEIAEQGDVP